MFHNLFLQDITDPQLFGSRHRRRCICETYWALNHLGTSCFGALCPCSTSLQSQSTIAVEEMEQRQLNCLGSTINADFDCFLHLFTVFCLKLSGGWQSTQQSLHLSSHDFQNTVFLSLTFTLLSCRDIGTKPGSEFYASLMLVRDKTPRLAL